MKGLWLCSGSDFICVWGVLRGALGGEFSSAAWCFVDCPQHIMPAWFSFQGKVLPMLCCYKQDTGVYWRTTEQKSKSALATLFVGWR